MSALAKCASVDFKTGIIYVLENSAQRTTVYQSHSAEQQMIIQAIALSRLGFQVYFKNEPADLKRKIQELETAIDFSAIISTLPNMSIDK